jgi:hypothetical protein
MKKYLIAAALAGALGAPAAPSYADTLIVRTAPPPLRHEVVPEPRHGYTWVAGHWDWNGHRYVWVHGKWIRDREGYVYHPQVWEERDGHWVAERGRWGRRDNDHDGVPNRADAAPNNPYRQ